MQRCVIRGVIYLTVLLSLLLYACGDTSRSEPAPMTTPDAGGSSMIDGSVEPLDGGEVRIADELLDQAYVRHLGVGERPIAFEWPAEVVGEVEVVEAPVGSFRIGDTPIAPGTRLAPEAFASALYVEDTRDPGPAGRLRLDYLTSGATRVELTVAVDLEVHSCDTLAASPLDPNRYAEGWYLVDASGSGPTQHSRPGGRVSRVRASPRGVSGRPAVHAAVGSLPLVR